MSNFYVSPIPMFGNPMIQRSLRASEATVSEEEAMGTLFLPEPPRRDSPTSTARSPLGTPPERESAPPPEHGAPIRTPSSTKQAVVFLVAGLGHLEWLGPPPPW
jgi:hypothetical protein